jgi:two-component system NtrC family sensor kinase
MKTSSAEKNLRILVVDDGRAIRGDFRKILSGESTTDKAQAIEAALFGDSVARRAVPFELDSAYQGKDGFEKVRDAVAKGRPYTSKGTPVHLTPVVQKRSFSLFRTWVASSL